MYIRKGKYDLLNNGTPVISEAFSDDIKKGISTVLFNALAKAPAVYCPAKAMYPIVARWSKDIMTDAYKLPVGIYAVVYDYPVYTIIECCVEDNIKTIRGIDCYRDNVTTYVVLDGMHQALFNNDYLFHLSLQFLVFNNEVGCERLALNQRTKKGKLLGTKYTSDFELTVIDFKQR